MNSPDNFQPRFSDETGRSIARAILKAIEKDQPEIIDMLTEFIKKILNRTFNQNLNTYSQFIVIPPFYYFKGYTSGKYSRLGIKAAETLTDLIRFFSKVSLNKINSFKELEKVNEFVYLTFKGYSDLFYQIILNNDIKSFTIIIDKYRLAYPHDSLLIPPYLSKPENKKKSFKTEYQNDIREYRKLPDYFRRVKFAVLSWLWFLYDRNQINKTDLLEYTELISFKKIDSNDLIRDLIYYNSYNEELFGWDRWDFMKRKELVSYRPPTPENWLTFGFALFSLKEFHLHKIDYTKIENSELFKHLAEKLQVCFEKLLSDGDKWIDIQWTKKEHKPDIEAIQNKINNIIEPFKILKRRYEKSIDKRILNQHLSVKKVNIFKREIYKAFDGHSAIREAFYQFQNLEKVENIVSERKEIIGMNINFEKAKMMFVDDDNKFIYGTEDWGSDIARELDERFISRIEKAKTSTFSNDINIAIEESLNIISSKEFEPNLIIVDSQLTYISNGITSNPNFVPSLGFPNQTESIFHVGMLNDIPIISVFNDSFKNKVLVCDFNNSFKAQEKINKDFFKKILDISVEVISDKEANQIYQRNQEKWEKNEDGILLTKEEAIELIKLTVNIKILYEFFIEVKDTDAFELIEIVENLISQKK